MIIPQKMTACLTKKQMYNDRFGLYEFSLTNGHKLSRKAGQYVMIEVAPGQMRAYSICTPPIDETSFSLLIDHAPAGLGITYLRSLAIGESVKILAPLGQLVLTSLAATHHYFLASGSGISPLRAMIEDQLSANDTTPLTLIWSMTKSSEFFWLERWQSLSRQHSCFTYHLLADKLDTTEFVCEHQYVPEKLSALKPAIGAHFYLCGSPMMVQASTSWLQAQGFGAKNWTLEHFSAPKGRLNK